MCYLLFQSINDDFLTNNSVVGQPLYELLHCPSNHLWRLLGGPRFPSDLVLRPGNKGSSNTMNDISIIVQL